MVDSIPEKMKISHEMEREHEILEKKYSVLKDKYMIASVSRASVDSARPSMRVVEWAIPPEKPSWPSWKILVAAALVLGAMMGIILSLLIDLVHGRVSRFRLSREYGELPLYAVLDKDRDFLVTLYDLPGGQDT